MENPRKAIKHDLVNLARNINFAAIRNFEFLFDNKIAIPNDLDLFVNSFQHSYKSTLEKSGYFLVSESTHKVIFAKIYGEIIFFLDFHVKTLTGNYISYGIEELLLKNSYKKEGIPVLSDEDYFCTLFMRELTVEGFKDKYKGRLKDLIKKADNYYVINFLKKHFNNNDSENIIYLMKQGRFDELEKIRTSLKTRFVLKHMPSYFKSLIALKLPKTKIIAIIGVDGSGKSTLANKSVEFLTNNSIKTSLLYMGRGGKNVLPVQTAGSVLKTRTDQSSKIIRGAIYSIGAVVYSLDLVIRYFSYVLPKKKENQYIITDRFTTDILLMKNVPKSLRKTLYYLLPKADNYVYIYNDINVLRKRRKDHDIEDIKRQLKEFVWTNDMLKPFKIKNDDIIKSRNAIVKHILSN